MLADQPAFQQSGSSICNPLDDPFMALVMRNPVQVSAHSCEHGFDWEDQDMLDASAEDLNPGEAPPQHGLDDSAPAQESIVLGGTDRRRLRKKTKARDTAYASIKPFRRQCRAECQEKKNPGNPQGQQRGCQSCPHACAAGHVC